MSKKKSPHLQIRKGLIEFGKNNSLKHPALSTKEHEDELRLLKHQHGVRRFPPKSKHIKNHTKAAPTSSEENKLNPPFLWVALKNRIKFVHEFANVSKRLSLKKVKHTNITSGQKAYSGGEMWFIAPRTVIVSGSSGRYGPKSETELNNIIKVFIKSGWDIKSLGWEEDHRRPAKYPR